MADVRVNEELLTMREVADMLSVSPKSVRRYIAKGEIPYIQFNTRLYRFRRSDVEKWLRTREGNPVEA